MRKTILITGASSGIGEAAAQYFLKRDWNVAATARDTGRIGSWAQAPHSAVFQLDVTYERSVSSAVNEAERAFGSIDVLLNNAGVGMGGPFEAISGAQLEDHFQTNFFGLARVTRAVLPVMRKQQSGTIINVSSVAGRFGLPFFSPYNAGKFAVEGLTESLRFELRPLGIRVKLVEPGGIKTSFETKFAEHDAYAAELSDVIERVRKPDRSLPGPELVAKAIWQAATDNSDTLRYAVATKGALTMNKILPEGAWHSLIRKSFGLKTRRVST